MGQTRLYLLGKNFIPNSRITYDYTMEGEAVLKSYPDFVMKGKDGTVYVFEVKSLAKSANQSVLDPEAYKKKVEALKRWYRVASGKLERYVFCVHVWDEEWLVYAYEGGSVPSLGMIKI